MICGIDEAGKGPVLGPMVIGAVGYDSKSFPDIPGLKDSKKLTHARREALYEKITETLTWSAIIISAEEIDELRAEMSMNSIVAHAHARAIIKLKADVAYVDACDVKEERYQETLTTLTGGSVEIIAKHKADTLFPVVSAASIIAKVTRDREIESLHQVWGNFGSGYPSDPLTISFLDTWIKTNKAAPLIARKSWETTKNLISRMNQKSLGDF